jgi:DNA-binding CsgD family transcriptional regulator
VVAAELTARERDILALMVRGQSNAAIAERLAVTPSTVKSHVRNILRKLGAVNRVEVIALAWESRR